MKVTPHSLFSSGPKARFCLRKKSAAIMDLMDMRMRRNVSKKLSQNAYKFGGKFVTEVFPKCGGSRTHRLPICSKLAPFFSSSSPWEIRSVTAIEISWGSKHVGALYCRAFVIMATNITSYSVNITSGKL